jgi:hypothetical protein
MNINKNMPPKLFEAVSDFLSSLRQHNERHFTEAFRRAGEQTKENNQRRTTRKHGVVGLSNADTIQKANQVKARLNAKLGEIMASELEPKEKMGFARMVMLELNKVEQKIADIKRREAALQQERMRPKKETEAERARRRYDMKERRVGIRRDLLYSATEGGFDPADWLPGGNPAYQVSVRVDMPNMTMELSDVSVPEVAIDTLI